MEFNRNEQIVAAASEPEGIQGRATKQYATGAAGRVAGDLEMALISPEQSYLSIIDTGEP